MTDTEHEPADTDEAAEQAAKDVKIDISPTGNWEPNTPPPVVTPTGNWEPNTPPPVTPTGNWEPNTPPPVVTPTGNWEPNTPPPVVTPTGNWEPNTPPPVVTPTGNWEPNTPPPVTPTGNWEPNTPPPDPNNAPAPAPAQATGAWVYGRRITHLFSSSASPGVWAWVPGAGWRRLAGSENGRGPLTTLALLAKTNGLAVSFHEDAAGQIDQLLV